MTGHSKESIGRSPTNWNKSIVLGIRNHGAAKGILDGSIHRDDTIARLGEAARENASAKKILDSLENGELKLDLSRTVNPEVICELLYAHTHGRFLFGEDSKQWNAFKQEIVSIAAAAKKLAVRISTVSKRRIFALNGFAPSFMGKQGAGFFWDQYTERPLSRLVDAMESYARKLTAIAKQGDRLYSYKRYKNLNVLLLSYYVKETTGRWQDLGVSAALEIACELANAGDIMSPASVKQLRFAKLQTCKKPNIVSDSWELLDDIQFLIKFYVIGNASGPKQGIFEYIQRRYAFTAEAFYRVFDKSEIDI